VAPFALSALPSGAGRAFRAVGSPHWRRAAFAASARFAVRQFSSYPPPMLIRPLPREERASLAPLLAAYAVEMRATLVGRAIAAPEAQAALLASHPAAELLVAEREGAPVGFAILFDLPEVVFARRCGQLDDLFVLPAARGQGIARALIAEACALGRARGWSHLRWIVPEGDVGAIAIYERIAARADWRSYVIRLDPAASL
jgi:GNAT superfamily N-acetyltransferase